MKIRLKKEYPLSVATLQTSKGAVVTLYKFWSEIDNDTAQDLLNQYPKILEIEVKEEKEEPKEEKPKKVGRRKKGSR
ncbi:MAG: hypothetical protein DRN30_02715 [Thermoplasmata archaeon]|nr:MAG: hypothetical protein DRN30_02715 [Thermoplasmata archaeon]